MNGLAHDALFVFLVAGLGTLLLVAGMKLEERRDLRRRSKALDAPLSDESVARARRLAERGNRW